jgi:hypothetical protein
MLRAPSQALVGAALVAIALLLGCGSEAPAPAPGERGPEYYAAALESVEKTPELLREELLKTCNKWRHLERPCDDAEVRRDQLECWVEKGERILAWVEARSLRPRARIMRTLLEVNVCMELKRWRKVTPGPDLDMKE